MVKALRDGPRIYQALQLQLFVAKLLLQPALFGINGTKPVEHPVVDAPQINCKD